MIRRSGILQIIYSDSGTHFENQVIDKLGQEMQIKLKITTYHSQSAGLVERIN